MLRWLKFNAVGGIGIGVQLAALAVLRGAFRLGYLPATVLAVETAVLHNFLWHSCCTWADRPAGGPAQIFLRCAKFHASNGGVSIGGNLALMWLLVGQLRMNYLAANLAAIVVCSTINFLMSDRFVFAGDKSILRRDRPARLR
jgi:putative flippase GtrA